ncbi:MAG: MFS transporter [Actinomycetes bacterium]
MSTVTEVSSLATVQRRTVRVLVASNVLGGVGVASGIAVGGLLAEQVSGSTSLAGLAQTGTVLGAALLALPLIRVADAVGRRGALALGYGLGLAGAVLAVTAAVLSWFWLLLVATVLFGGGTASNLQARYAATDAATEVARGRALSVVVWATTVGAVAGPNLSGLGGSLGRALGVPPLAGPFLFSVVSFGTAATAVLLLLRPDPLRTVRAAHAVREGAVRPARPRLAETLRAVATRPRARLGLAAVTVGHAVMVGVMVMTPVHLGHHGATLTVVGVVISLHVAGMYALSPVMGWLADRAGRVATIGVGLGVLAASVVVGALAPPQDHALVGLSLFLLGVGWSGTLVGGSTLLSESVPPEVRTAVQGTSDLTMGLAGALAGALAGPVLAWGGFTVLTWCAGALLVPVVVQALLVRRAAPGAATSGPARLSRSGRASR